MKAVKFSLFVMAALSLVLLAGCASRETKVVTPRAEARVGRVGVGVGGAEYEAKTRVGPQIVTMKLADITTTSPDEVGEGETFKSTIKVVAKENIAHVVVRMMVPDGMEYVKSTPEGTRDGSMITWKYPSMDANDSQEIEVMLKATKVGSYKPCASVDAAPQVCFVVKVVKPKISIKKTGPATAMLNDYVDYTIVVKNEGDGLAKEVVVTDTVPEGLAHDSGKSTLVFKIGDLPAKQEKRMTVKLKAVKRGEPCNVVKVETSNAGQSESEACTLVQLEDFTVEKTGMAEQYLGKKADYTITVKNVGDTTLKNVRVNDSAAQETSVVEAKDASVTTEKGATWVIDTLKPGAEETFELLLTSRVPGTHKNRVSVTAGKQTKDADADTLWKGMAAILLEVIDTDDPLQAEEETTYIIRVTNQGTKEDKNIHIWAQFPTEVIPVSTTGSEVKGTVDGLKVDYEAYPVLNPKQSITYKIQAKGKEPGDGRIKVYLQGDLLKTPVVEEESTHVY